MNKDLDYMNWVYGGRHIRTNEPGVYVKVTDYLNYQGPVFHRQEAKE